VEFDEILAIMVLAVICFIAGLIVRTRAGLRAKNAIERRVLQRLPGYTLLRGLAGRVTGQADEPSFAPALAETHFFRRLRRFGAGAFGHRFLL
jgi:hypothetical protein